MELASNESDIKEGDSKTHMIYTEESQLLLK